jgi:hypothetical protein
MARSRDVIIPAVTGAVGIVVGALVTAGFGYLSHKGDVDARMIELSIGILRAEPTKESASLRDWAIQVINDRSDVKFDDAQKEALRKKEFHLFSHADHFGNHCRSVLPTEHGRPDCAKKLG